MLSEQFNKPVDGSANYESPSGTQDKIIFSLSFIYLFFFCSFSYIVWERSDKLTRVKS